MKLIKFLLGIFFLMIVSQVAYAQVGDKLLILEVDVEVDDRSSNNLNDGDRIRREAKPESDVEFKIKIKNNFTSAEGLEIQDIEVTVTIEEIDDDEDLDDDAKDFDLNDGDDKRVKISFKLPLEIDEGTYDVVIEIEGEDENGTLHRVTATLDLEVEKERHEVRFLKKSLNPTELTCQRSVQLSIGVINTGQEEEEQTVLELINEELGISFRETFDLSDDPFDKDSKFSKLYTVRIPEDQSVGVYPILAQVIYDDGDEVTSTNLDLVINACEIQTKVEEEEEEEPEVVVVTPQPITPPLTPTPIVTISQPAVTEEKSLLGSAGFVAVLIVGEILVVVAAVFLVMTLMRRRV